MIKCGITKLRVSNKRQLNQIHVVALRHLFHAYCNCLRRLRRLASCPSLSVNGGYSEWSGFSVCTRQCNGGVKVRSRTCSNPFPQHGGQDCQGLGPSSESRHCNTHPCPGNSKKKRRMKRVTHLIGQYANRTINIKSKETSILIFVKIYSLCVPQQRASQSITQYNGQSITVTRANDSVSQWFILTKKSIIHELSDSMPLFRLPF